MKLKLHYVLFICSVTGCNGQDKFGEDKLTLEKVIEMPGVRGRIDHMAVNLKDKVLYLAALGNNTVEVIGLQKGTLLRSIKGVDEPQGLAYIPEQNEIAVASGDKIMASLIIINYSFYHLVNCFDFF